MVKICFDEIEIELGGFTKIIELFAFELGVAAAEWLFENSVWTDFVADGHLLKGAEPIGPAFVPNPDVFL